MNLSDINISLLGIYAFYNCSKISTDIVFSEDIPKRAAMPKAKNPTCDNPSPIIEYLLSTKLTPKTEAQRQVKIPTNKA